MFNETRNPRWRVNLEQVNDSIRRLDLNWVLLDGDEDRLQPFRFEREKEVIVSNTCVSIWVCFQIRDDKRENWWSFIRTNPTRREGVTYRALPRPRPRQLLFQLKYFKRILTNSNIKLYLLSVREVTRHPTFETWIINEAHWCRVGDCRSFPSPTSARPGSDLNLQSSKVKNVACISTLEHQSRCMIYARGAQVGWYSTHTWVTPSWKVSLSLLRYRVRCSRS